MMPTPPRMMEYTVSFVVRAPETIPRDDVEREVRRANLEFKVGNSRLFPLGINVDVAPTDSTT